MGFFDRFFGRSKEIKKTKTKVVDYFTPFFADFGDDITRSHVVQEAVNSITKHASKLKLSHYTKNQEGLRIAGRKALNEILQYHPNPIENGADFLEKVAYHWLTGNNAFIYLHFIPSNVFADKEVLDSLWVLDPYDTKVSTDNKGDVWLTFSIKNETEQITTHVDNVAVIKRNVGQDEFFGRSNNNIKQVLKVIDTNYSGIENAIKSSAYIRFIIESSSVLNPEVKKQKADQFKRDFLTAENDGGVVFTDTANKITQIESKGTYVKEKELEIFYKQVYHYFGTNENIIKGDYTDQQWNSFYESTIEPLVNKLEIELTKKIFTQNERARGNQVLVETNRLQQMSIASRLSMIQATREIGLMTINEMRELIYMPPVEGGDVREVSLNYIDADKQSVYQIGAKPKKEEEEEQEDEQE